MRITPLPATSREKGNCGVWDRLRKQVALERQQLGTLFEMYRPLLQKCADNPPNEIELSALAAMLHSFYSGIENIFKRIAAEVDGRPPGGEFWHRELLDAMVKPGKARPAVLSSDLADRLDDYLQFRHVFRHAYTFNLRWDRMRSLALGCEETLHLLEDQLDEFLKSDAAPGR